MIDLRPLFEEASESQCVVEAIPDGQLDSARLRVRLVVVLVAVLVWCTTDQVTQFVHFL